MSSSFIDRLVEAERRIAELERRGRNRKRTGVVSEVDTAKGLARVKIMDGDRPYVSPWVPWKEVASGGIKSHIPPTVGEQVDLVSESGDLTDAVIDMSTPSNANPRPHDGPEAVITHGSTRITVADGSVQITANVMIRGALAIEGDAVTHNGKDIGDTHRHGNVMTGGGVSGVPV